MLKELRSTPFTAAKTKSASTIAHTGELRRKRPLPRKAKEEVGGTHVLRMSVFAHLMDTLTSDDAAAGRALVGISEDKLGG